MRKHRFIWVLLTAALTLPAQAAELDITLGNDSIRGEYVAPMGRKVADNVSTLDLGVLYNEESNADLLLGHLGLMIYGDTGARKANVQAGLGGRAILLDADGGYSGLAIALGGMVNGRVPDFNHLGGKVWLFYAPDVAAFDDIDGYLEYGVGIDYQLIRQASLIAGYRKLEAENDGPGEVDLESGAYFGLKFVF